MVELDKDRFYVSCCTSETASLKWDISVSATSSPPENVISTNANVHVWFIKHAEQSNNWICTFYFIFISEIFGNTVNIFHNKPTCCNAYQVISQKSTAFQFLSCSFSTSCVVGWRLSQVDDRVTADLLSTQHSTKHVKPFDTTPLSLKYQICGPRLFSTNSTPRLKLPLPSLTRRLFLSVGAPTSSQERFVTVAEPLSRSFFHFAGLLSSFSQLTFAPSAKKQRKVHANPTSTEASRLPGWRLPVRFSTSHWKYRFLTTGMLQLNQIFAATQAASFRSHPLFAVVRPAKPPPTPIRSICKESLKPH